MGCGKGWAMIKELFYFGVAIATAAVLVIVFGFWWRILSFLFCIGYGC